MSRCLVELLDKWQGRHKARSVELSIEDGYGCSAWRCVLYGENKSHINAIEYPGNPFEEGFEAVIFVDSDEHDYIGYLLETAASKRTLWVASKSEPDDWPGPEIVILAAIEAMEKQINE